VEGFWGCGGGGEGREKVERCRNVKCGLEDSGKNAPGSRSPNTHYKAQLNQNRVELGTRKNERYPSLQTRKSMGGYKICAKSNKARKRGGQEIIPCRGIPQKSGIGGEPKAHTSEGMWEWGTVGVEDRKPNWKKKERTNWGKSPCFGQIQKRTEKGRIKRTREMIEDKIKIKGDER